MTADGHQAAYATLMTWTDQGVRYRSQQATRENLRVANHVDLNVLVVRRELLQRLGGFDTSLPRTVDYDLVLRIADATDRLEFDRLYNNFGGVIATDARAMVRFSADRHAAWVRGDQDQLT